MKKEGEKLPASPATLVAVLVAARRAGDREMERVARRELDGVFGMRVSFRKDNDGKK